MDENYKSVNYRYASNDENPLYIFNQPKRR